MYIVSYYKGDSEYKFKLFIRIKYNRFSKKVANITVHIDDHEVNGEYYKFACKRRYASDSDDPRIPSEYSVICFYFNPGEEYIYYIYLTDEEDYINLDKDLFSALNLRDSLTKESVMINHVLHRIHDNKVW